MWSALHARAMQPPEIESWLQLWHLAAQLPEVDLVVIVPLEVRDFVHATCDIKPAIHACQRDAFLCNIWLSGWKREQIIVRFRTPTKHSSRVSDVSPHTDTCSAQHHVLCNHVVNGFAPRPGAGKADIAKLQKSICTVSKTPCTRSSSRTHWISRNVFTFCSSHCVVFVTGFVRCGALCGSRVMLKLLCADAFSLKT
eukprot:2196854-Amphidinium_carterae.1